MPASAVILGLGTFGGGLGAARHLVRQGHDVLITDLRSKEELAKPLAELRPELDAGSITLRLGEHNVSDVTTCELLVVNPAIKKPWENRFVRAAHAAGVRTTTEIALALDALPESCTRVGVTGSAGKSTTAAMIHAGLIAAGRTAHLGGNIGGSLLDRMADITRDEAVVVELSSAQLWWLDQPSSLETDRWFDAAVVTNLAENHLDWHGDFDHYAHSKHVLTKRLDHNAWAVLGEGVSDFPTHAKRAGPAPDDAFPKLAVPAAHNRINASLALAACEAVCADTERAAHGIAHFPGLPHRLQFIREHKGVRYINDSKSTTPDATRLAVAAFDAAHVHLIVGGSDKGADLSPIAELGTSVRSLLCIGATGNTIAAIAGVEPMRTLEHAVAAANARAEPGDTVLLSPGCASFDQFASFEDRGNRFGELVHSLQ